MAGDDFHFPSGGRFDPFGEDAGVAGVAQGAGGHHPRAVHGKALHGTMKAAQHLERVGHGLGIEAAVAEYALAQTRNLAVLVQRDEPSFDQVGDAETNGVGTDIDSGEDRHRLCLPDQLGHSGDGGGRLAGFGHVFRKQPVHCGHGRGEPGGE